VEALRATLQSLLASETRCAEQGVRARQRVLDQFSWQAIGARYLDLLAEAAQSRKG
jgi:glycosyltransferase involved in cell wall biosynthesis